MVVCFVRKIHHRDTENTENAQRLGLIRQTPRKSAKRKYRETGNADIGKQEHGEADEALRGLAALPSPSPGDLFLDFEGDPFAFDQGLEYPIRTVSEKNFEFRIADFEFKDKELGRENFGLREKKFEVRNLKSEIHYEGLWSFNREGKRSGRSSNLSAA